jgi:hypothetical protein
MLSVPHDFRRKMTWKFLKDWHVLLITNVDSGIRRKRLLKKRSYQIIDFPVIVTVKAELQQFYYLNPLKICKSFFFESMNGYSRNVSCTLNYRYLQFIDSFPLFLLWAYLMNGYSRNTSCTLNYRYLQFIVSFPIFLLRAYLKCAVHINL